jgi:hypothetical protein
MNAAPMLRGGFVLSAALALSACVTEIQKPVSEVALFTTRAGDQVGISWMSRPGETYAVYYAESRQSGVQWKVLPGCERVAGTGGTIEKIDHVPAGMPRYYRLVVVPAH